MTSKAPVFEKIYQDYLARVAGLDLKGKQDLLGIRVTNRPCSSLFSITPLPSLPGTSRITGATVPLIPCMSFCASTCC